MSRQPVIPHQVVVLLPVHDNVVILGVALVRAFRDEAALTQDGGIDCPRRDVVPRWKAGLVQVDGRSGLCDGLAPYSDFYWT